MSRRHDSETGSTGSDDAGGSWGPTRRTVIKTVGAGAVAAGAGATFAGSSSAVTIPTPTLHTEGRWIRDPNGNDVRLRGFAPASLDFIARDWYPKSWEEILEWATDGQGRGWHPTCIRLPITQEGIVHHGGIETFISDYLRPAVDYLATRNVYVMIDFHLIRPYTQPATEDYNADQDSEEDQVDPIDDVMRNFWNAVAPEFAEDSHVVYELFNEPTYPNTWSEYGQATGSREDSWLLWRETAQPWVDLVQDHAPERPLVIGSPDWTSETQFAPDYPFTGDNLIYAAHIYPDNGQPSDFDNEYGAPAEEVPCFLTEFGWDPNGGQIDQGTNSGWGQPVREWVEGYENYSWTGWCFDDSWAPTFFESPADNPQQGAGEPWGIKAEGEFFKQWLADTRDQQTPEATFDDNQAPPAPANLRVERASEVTATVAWDAVTDNGQAGVSNYTVYVDGERAGQVTSDTTSFTVDGLSPSSTYTVAVEAVDGLNNVSPQSSVTVETIARDEGQSPYDGTNAIPGTVEAEDFDEGGQGVAYYDGTEGNAGGSSYRDTDVDLESSDGGGTNVGFFEAGEWLEYTVQAEGTGSYVLFLNAANGANSNAEVSIEIDGEEVATHGVWPTNGWQNWTEMRVGPVDITAGQHIVRITTQSGSWNFDWVRFDGQDVDQVDDTTAPSAPGSPSVSSTTSTSATVSWGAATDSGGSGLDHYVVYVDGSQDQTVTAGTTQATVTGLSPATTYDVGVTAVDAAGNESSSASTQVTTTEGSGEGPPTLPDGSQPADLDGDGLTRDVNGNGRLDSDDVVTYFENMDSAAVQDNVGFYDYNENGRIDFDDVVTLFESL